MGVEVLQLEGFATAPGQELDIFKLDIIARELKEGGGGGRGRLPGSLSCGLYQYEEP